MPFLANSSSSEPPHRGACTSRDLKRILHAIADQIAAEDEERAARLSGLKDRLDLLGSSKGPDGESLLIQFATGHEGLDAVPVVGPAPLKSASSMPAIFEHPSASQRARADDVGQVGADDHSSGTNDQGLAQPEMERRGAVAAHLGNDELGMVFIEIADKLDAAMSAMPSAAVMEALELRLKAIESRMAEMECAGRSGAVNDQQVSEIINHILEAQRELDRLDRVESELRSLAERMSEDKLAGLIGERGLGPEDCERIARQVIDCLEDATVPNTPREGPTGELQETFQRFMIEQREGDERTTMMLDTMQQALIRLLDRIDELEFDRSHRAGYGPFETGHSGKALDAAHSAENSPVAEIAADGANVRPDNAEVRTADMPETNGHIGLGKHEGISSPTATGHLEEREREISITGAASQSKSRDASELTDEDQAARSHSERTALIASARRAAQLAASGRTDGVDTATQENAARESREAVAANATKDGARKSPEKSRSSFFRLPFTSSAIILIGLSIGYQSFEILSWMPKLGLNQATNPVATMKTDPGSAVANNGVVPLDDMHAEGAIRSASDTGEITTHLPATDVQQRELQDVRLQSAAHTPTIVHEVGSSASADNQPKGISVSLNGASENGGPAATAGVESVGATKFALPPSRIGPLSLRLAAANGDPSAEFEVAARFAEGKGIEHDLKEAATWYTRSAARGFAAAQYRIATLYERGVGVARDLERAKAWYQQAAEHGHVKAMHNLGVLLAGMNDGRGDYAAAARWFIEAAEYGLKDSQFNLAILFDSGLGLPRNEKLAYKWFAIAAKGGDEDAMRRMQRVQAKITTSDLVSIKGEIERWAPKAKDHLVNDPRAAGELWKRRAVAAEPN